MAGALTGRWDRLPRIAPRTRFVFFLSGSILVSFASFFIVGGPADQDRAIAGAVVFGPIFVVVLIVYIRVLRHSGPRDNASYRLISEQDPAEDLPLHRVRSTNELWRDFPSLLISRALLAISTGYCGLNILIYAFAHSVHAGRNSIVYGSAAVVFLLLFTAARHRYLRLRDVDFATAPPSVIHVVAALLVDSDGRALMVRKRGTDRFMQPGGKPEAGETDAEALSRELKEELGLVIPPSELTFVGQFVTAAANEEDTVLYADVFDAPVVTSAVAVRAEIEELLWVDPANPGHIELAPLSSDELLPLLAARRTGPSSP